MRSQNLVLVMLLALSSTSFVFAANKADCNGSGDLVPFADFYVSKDTLETRGSVELTVKTSANALYLRMFYVDASGNLKTLIMAPQPADVPSQTKQVDNLWRTTTVALVAKTDTGAMVCVLTVPFVLPQEMKKVGLREWCPAGFAMVREYDRGAECARVMPAFATETISQYNPQQQGYYAVCEGGYYALDGGIFVSNGTQGGCRTDGWKAINPLVGTSTADQFGCSVYATAGEVRFATGIRPTLDNPYICNSRKLGIPEDSAATKQTIDAANAYAAAKGAR